MAVRRLSFIFLIVLVAGGVFAQQTATVPRTEAVTADTDRDAENPQALRLSLNEAVETTVSRNLGIDLQRFDNLIAAHEIRRQYGLFDPAVEATVAQASAEETALTALEGGSRQSTILNLGVRQVVPTGGSYTVGFDNSRLTRAGPFVTFSPGYSTDLNFNATQPLLRDFGLDINRRGITIARNTLGVSRAQFRDVLNETALLVELAYLDLVYARRHVEVVKETLFLARDQARITQIRIDVGASAPLDILQPRVQIAQTEETLIRAVASVREAEDRLRQLMSLPLSEWDRPIVPTDEFDYAPTPINVEAAIARAYEQRPEIDQQRLHTANARVRYLYARNQTLPALDFNVGYGLAGIGGRTLNPQTGQPNPDIPATSYTDALENIFSNDFPSWNVGFRFAMPITNIGARAAARQAELELEQWQERQALTKQDIAIEVRNAARDVDASARAIAAARAAREAAAQNVEAERKRYENGITTNFQVLQVQQQLSDARRTELQAVIGYNAAVARYYAATGDLLDRRDIATELPEIPEEPRMFRFLDRYNWLNYGSRVNVQEE